MGERFGQHPGLMQGDIGDRYTRKRLSDEVYVAHHIKVGDQIRVQCFLATGVAAAVTTVTLFVGGRVRGLDGELTQFGNTFAFTADGAQTVSYVMAPEGYVVDLIAATDTLGLGATDVGVKIDILQGIGSNAVAVGLLASGYVSYAHALGLGGAGNISGGSGGGMRIGGTVTSGTAGSVLFVGAGPVLAQDNANLFFNDSTNMLALATAGTPAAFDFTGGSVLDIGVSATRGLVLMRGKANDSGDLSFLTMGGTFAVPLATASGVQIGQISFTGWGADDDVHQATAIKGVVDDTVSGGNMPGRLEFYTTTTTTARERMRISSVATAVLAALNAASSVGIAGQLELQAPPYLTGRTIAGLPASPLAGQIAYVTDSLVPVIGSTVSAGGSAAALVWYNGANWTVIGK